MYIKDGEIAEVGTHDELMGKKGFYYQLYWAQHAEETGM
jgi:ATP-binding cassette subfamily B protein